MFKKKPKVVEKKAAPKKAQPEPIPIHDTQREYESGFEAIELLRELDKEAGAFMAMGSMGTVASNLIEKIRSYLHSHG